MNYSTTRDLGIEIDHETDRGVYRGHVADDETTSTTVVALTGIALDQDAIELPPLHHTIDTDALNSLFAPDDDGGDRSRVEFTYAGCEVTVFGDGQVVVDGRSETTR